MPPTLMRAILAALENIGPMTAAELRRHLDREKSTLFQSLRVLRFRKIVHISGWQGPEYRGRRAPVYALGNKPDVVEPPAVGVIERNRKHRAAHAAVISARAKVKRGTAGPANPWQGLL